MYKTIEESRKAYTEYIDNHINGVMKALDTYGVEILKCKGFDADELVTCKTLSQLMINLNSVKKNLNLIERNFINLKRIMKLVMI